MIGYILEYSIGYIIRHIVGDILGYTIGCSRYLYIYIYIYTYSYTHISHVGRTSNLLYIKLGFIVGNIMKLNYHLYT